MTVEKVLGQRNFRGVAPAERRAERRGRLLAAGIKQFGARGFHRTTVREICGEAQLTERYFYESFANLGALFVAVHGQINELLRDLTVAAVMSAPQRPLAMVEAAVRAYLTFLAEDHERGRVLLVESVTVGDDVLPHAAASRRDFAALVRGFAEPLFPAAIANGLHIDMLSSGVIGATNYIAHDWLREDLRTPFELVLQAILTIYGGVVEQLSRAEESATSKLLARANAKKSKPRTRAR